MSLDLIAAKITQCRPIRSIRSAAYSLVESLIVLAISSCLILSCLSLVHRTYHEILAQITIAQLKQIINYARSIAILQQQKVIICPSHNKYSCGGSWNKGILMLSGAGESRFFNNYLPRNGFLSLTQSGRTNDFLEIIANGMTYTNGHFSYRLLNSTYIPEHNLYFNRALRTYLLTGAY